MQKDYIFNKKVKIKNIKIKKMYEYFYQWVHVWTYQYLFPESSPLTRLYPVTLDNYNLLIEIVFKGMMT